MSSPAVPGEANSGLSAERANQMYWLSGLAPMATCLVTPLMVFWRMRKVPLPMVKYNQQVNEVGRQFIGGTIGLVAYFGGGELTRGALNAIGWGKARDQNKMESNQQIGMMLGGTLMNFLGYAILRPMISTPFICKFLKREGQQLALNSEQAYELLETALKRKMQPDKPAELRKFIEIKIADSAKKGVSDTQPEGFPIRQIQRWIEGHLFDAVGNPLLGKTAGVATIALAGWFSVVTAVLYVLNQALGGPKAKKSPAPPVLPPPQWLPPVVLAAPVFRPPMANLMPAYSKSPSNMYPYTFR